MVNVLLVVETQFIVTPIALVFCLCEDAGIFQKPSAQESLWRLTLLGAALGWSLCVGHLGRALWSISQPDDNISCEWSSFAIRSLAFCVSASHVMCKSLSSDNCCMSCVFRFYPSNHAAQSWIFVLFSGLLKETFVQIVLSQYFWYWNVLVALCFDFSIIGLFTFFISGEPSYSYRLCN